MLVEIQFGQIRRGRICLSPAPDAGISEGTPSIGGQILPLRTNSVTLDGGGPGGDVLDANKAFTEILGYSREEVIGRNPRLWKSDRHDEAFYREMWRSIGQTGEWRGEIPTSPISAGA